MEVIMSYTEQLVHAVFRTYASQPTLPIDERNKNLFKIIWGIIKNKGGILYRINAMSDHVHILFALPATIALSDFIKAIKASSSKIIKSNDGFEKFTGWGKGYAAVTHNVKDKSMIINYIINQQEHHKKISFREEWEEFIKEMGLVFDERDWKE